MMEFCSSGMVEKLTHPPAPSLAKRRSVKQD